MLFLKMYWFLFLLIHNFLIMGNEIAVSEYLKEDLEESKSFISQFISSGDLVFDVGAHIGKKAEMYLALGARVVCIEPQPQCVSELKKKFNENDHVVIEEKGLASTEDTLELFQCLLATTISTFSFEYTQRGRFFDTHYIWDEKITVPVTTLDAMIQKHGIPDFCKIDVENFEYEVLKGLSTPIKCISFESNTEWLENTKKCIFLLEELGYQKFNFSIAERGWFMHEEWLPAGIFYEKLREESLQDKWQEIGGLWGDVYAHYE